MYRCVKHHVWVERSSFDDSHALAVGGTYYYVPLFLQCSHHGDYLHYRFRARFRSPLDAA